MRKIPPFLLLDAWRGVAAFWVVMAHACISFLATADNGRFIHFPLYAVSIWGRLGVVIFFVISGYCIMGAAYSTLASGRTSGRYGFDRVRRIYPPYLAAFALALGFGFLTGLAQSHHLLPPSHHEVDQQSMRQPLFWLANLFITQMELGQPALLIVAWSLCYEVIFYVLIGIMLIIAQARARRPSGAMVMPVFQMGIGGLTFLSLAWLNLSPKTCPFPLDCWYQFGLGALLFLLFAADTPLSIWYMRGQLILAGILALLFAIYSGGVTHPFHLGYPSRSVQAATSLIFTIVLWALRPWDERLAHRRVLRPLMWLGTISYSIYLAHTIVMGFADAAGRRFGFDQNRYWVTYLVEIATGLAAGWLFHLAVERHFISSRQKQRVEVELGK